jgi:hypothetical protein
MGLTHNANLDEMRELAKGCLTSKCCDELQDKTALHLKHLAELIDAPYKYDSHQIRKEHENLDNEIASFVNKFRKKKKKYCHYRKVMKKKFKRLTAWVITPQFLTCIYSR